MNFTDLSIDQLADLRDRVVATLAERVADRQRELSNEVSCIGGLLTQPGKSKPLKMVSTKLKYQKGENTWSGRGTEELLETSWLSKVQPREKGKFDSNVYRIHSTVDWKPSTVQLTTAKRLLVILIEVRPKHQPRARSKNSGKCKSGTPLDDVEFVTIAMKMNQGK
jgi:hypothetical protein